ncbi:hypothetical protein BN439_1046 [Erwinia amylovora Ea644]|nr:hypothetical protein BN439_1046 [Erwinia amylovora Ea644]CCP06161.1 hypothetical protein BN440_1112 [Erwinia amylovora MR1]
MYMWLIRRKTLRSSRVKVMFNNLYLSSQLI